MNKDEKIAVLGFGVEGKDVLNYLKKHGFENITVLDKKNRNELDLKGIDASGIKFITGKDYLKNGLAGYSVIFRSPGFYRYIPEIIKAEKGGSEITSNIKYFLENYKGLSIGVTGTKGKGTTSTLIYEILRQVYPKQSRSAQDKSLKKSNREIYLTGNIGSPPLSILDSTDSNSIVILELSSFQLIDLNNSPNIAVVLNVTSDHMDWHKNQKEYVDAKKNIVRFQNKDDLKVINYDYGTSKSFADTSLSMNYFFSKEKRVQGVYVKDGKIITSIHPAGVHSFDYVQDRSVTHEVSGFEVGSVDKLLLRGKHNWENVCAAICASQLAGADINSIKKTVFSFKGLEHRLELVGVINGVTYYNDSFSTNPQTTIAAVDSFTEAITLVLGGYDKGLAFDEMVKHLCKKKNLQNIILIGNTQNKLNKLLRIYEFNSSIVKLGKSDMTEIVAKCKEVTKKGGVVLLSPACASFDMFSDYKDRGDQFKEIVAYG
ncbi:MAG: UDP-N-acetylmuramoyl-L-alanyl-D-glutamate synthetase [Microgenomates group bacterium GW2011_GWF1_38_5]|nr:MAG: UDP-N-acetylmuramoyl-L-alanyl-D-glutamate synthetase [Microgenomates group bacterium GW2011_GWF1_38_5]